MEYSLQMTKGKGKRENYTRWCIEHDLKILADWFKANKLTLNLNKTVAMSFGKNKNMSQLQISGYCIPWVDKTKFLGMWLDKDLTWKVHIENLCLHLKHNMYLLRNPKNLFDRYTLKTIYYAHIQSHVNYGLLLWGNSVNKAQLNKVSSLQITTNYKFGYKVVNHLLPKKILEIVMTDKNNMNLIKVYSYNTRNKCIPNIPVSSKSSYSKSFLVKGISAIGTVPYAYRDLKYKCFTKKCKQLISQ